MHLGLEHRHAAGRAQALAVHHAHAAQTGAPGLAQEGAQGFARLVGAQAVQIHLSLHGPVAAAQPGGHVGADAGAAKAQVLVHVQQRAGVELVAQGFAQHPRLVQLALHGQGLGRHGRVPMPLVRRAFERLHGADGVPKQAALRLGAVLGLLLQAQLLGLARGGVRQRLAQRPQILERFGFHGDGDGVVHCERSRVFERPAPPVRCRTPGHPGTFRWLPAAPLSDGD